MKSLSEIKTLINKNSNYLRNTYKVKKIGVFGSMARNEGIKTSDVDILVEFYRPISMFKFIDLEEYLSKVIGTKVDLVTKRALKPAIKDDILREVVYV